MFMFDMLKLESFYISNQSSNTHFKSPTRGQAACGLNASSKQICGQTAVYERKNIYG